MAVTLASINHFGAEYNDKDTDTNSAAFGVVNAQASTTFVATGTYSMALDMTTNGNKAYCAQTSLTSGNIRLCQFALALSGTPTQELGLITENTQGGQKRVAIGTDRKIRFYTHSGAQVGPTPSTTIPTSAPTMQRFYLVIDSLTLPSVYISYSFDGTTWESFDTGLSQSAMFGATGHLIGEYLPAGSNPGVTLYIDDFTVTTLTGSDVPHTTGPPKYLILGAVVPDSDGNYTEHTNESAGTASYTSVDETGTNDGDTTYWQSTTANQRQLCKSSTANPLPGGATIAGAMFKHAARLTGSGKLPWRVLLRNGGTDALVNLGQTPTSTYAGHRSNPVLTEPGGSAWDYADADADATEWGVQSDGSTPGQRITQFKGPEWIYYTASMSASPTPTSSASIFLRNQKVRVAAPEVRQIWPPSRPFVGLFAAGGAPPFTPNRVKQAHVI